MATFISDTTFDGYKEGRTFEKNVPFDMTVERANEIKANIKKNHNLDIVFTRLDVPDSKDAKKEAKEVPEKEVEEVEEAKKEDAKEAKEGK